MDSMGDRMKSYETASEQILPIRLPVILRLDGNSFSRFTKVNDFKKPFDEKFDAAMNAAAKAVLSYCSGSCVAYLQSDEMTILLRNNQTVDTDPFLGNRTQKLTSLTAAKASVAFNRALTMFDIDAQAVFDCRAFVVPHYEVQNVFLWRQFDAFKNCISAYAYYKLKEKYGRKTAMDIFKLHFEGKALSKKFSVDKAAEVCVEALFDPKHVLFRVETTEVTQDFTLKHIVNGAMVAGIVDQACANALYRDLEAKAKKPTGVREEDITAAVEAVLEQNLGLNQDDELRAFAATLKGDLKAVEAA